MWLSFALLSALASAVANLARRIRGQHSSAVIIAWWTQLIAAMVAGALVWQHGGLGRVEPGFWLPATGAALITSYTAVTMIKAFQLSDASLVSPIMNFLPVFLLGSSFLMLGETPGIAGLAGVIVISAGAFYINSHNKHGLMAPIKAIYREKGARLIILVTLLWSISTNLDKVAIRNAPTATLVLYLYVVIWLLLSAYIYSKPKLRRELVVTFTHHQLAIIILSVASALTLYFQTRAIAGEFVSYVLAIKRVDVLLTVTGAALIFHEKQFRRRLFGAIIMLIGVCLILLV